MKSLRVVCLVVGALLLGYLSFQFLPNWLVWLYQDKFGLVEPASLAARSPFATAAITIFGAAIGMAFVGENLFRISERAVRNWDSIHPGDRFTIMVAMAAGVMVTVPFMSLFVSQGLVSAVVISAGMMVMLGVIFYRALRSIDDILPWTKNWGRAKRSDLKILDTNVIIDGRIYDILRTGFLDGQMYVPQFVLDELQYIADHADSARRQRGKRGLEVLNQLKSLVKLEVGIHDRHAPDTKEQVDSRLVKIARATGGDLVTNDFNLNRVASLQEVKVINVNELALALRPTVLPAELLTIQIVKEGSQKGQGVGYLDDGTMVVIERGAAHVGETLEIEVTQVHQSERGKMIFGEVPGELEESNQDPYGPRRKYRR